MLRPHRPGDIGWIVHRHGVLYFEEYGWGFQFEALVADVCARFLKNFDPDFEFCWVAEQNGQIVGSVFVVKESPEIAKLRLLWVEPSARGTGLGSELVQECIQFARKKGYRKLTLWTNNPLHSARKIYEAAGFRLAKEQVHTLFGPELTGQDWDLEL